MMAGCDEIRRKSNNIFFKKQEETERNIKRNSVYKMVKNRRAYKKQIIGSMNNMKSALRRELTEEQNGNIKNKKERYS